MDGGAALFVHCDVRSNSAEFRGGGIYIEGGADAEVISCIIAENGVPSENGFRVANGGGVAVEKAEPLLLNCVIVDNISDQQGGGIADCDAAGLRIVNCTISRNESITDASNGFAQVCSNASSATIDNSIFWDNHGPLPVNQILADENALTVAYSDVQGGWPGTGNVDVDPMFGGPAAINYRLRATSPVRDIADEDRTPTDQHDIDEDGDVMELTPDADVKDRLYGSGVDIGAYEWIPCPTDINGDSVVDVDDQIAVILSWGPCEGDCPADINGDGTVDVDDLIAVILTWGPCIEQPMPKSVEECMEQVRYDPMGVIGCFEAAHYFE